jgi:hypothetical protein
MKSSRIGSYYVCLLLVSSNENESISLQDGENTIFYLMHPGVYRKCLITTSLEPEKIVRYMHQSIVLSEMNLFVGMMRASGFPIF